VAHVAVLGISGRVGSRVAAELLRRHHTVTGLARSVQSVPAQSGLTVKAVDAADPDALATVVSGHDALVSATRFVGGIIAPALIAAAKRGGVKRVLVVGGAGSLRTAPGGGALVDTPGFPASYQAEARAGLAFLETLRGERELEWTFLSPSAEFAPGPRTTRFRLGTDELLIDAQGKSHISMEDYAIAMVDEIEKPRHIRRRFTVGY
jgi:hypothetical protein